MLNYSLLAIRYTAIPPSATPNITPTITPQGYIPIYLSAIYPNPIPPKIPPTINIAIWKPNTMKFMATLLHCYIVLLHANKILVAI